MLTVGDQKLLYKNDKSTILIRNGRMYIVSNRASDFYAGALTVLPGFQVELGRRISEIKDALSETKLPIALEKVVDAKNIQQYNVIRMETGPIPARSIATIHCTNGVITGVSFHRYALDDVEFRKKVKLSILHQLAIPAEASNEDRKTQIRNLLASVRMTIAGEIEIEEKGTCITATVNSEGTNLQFTFLANSARNGQYELSSIKLAR